MHPTDLRYSKVCLSGSRAVVRLAMAVLVLVLAALAGCGAAPVQEMSEARQAIEAARVAGAPQHAPASYARARALLKSAEDMLNKHHFRRARENATMARDEAIEARDAAQRISPE